MEEFVKKVVIKGSVCGTTDVMDWADEHPDARFDYTYFESELGGWRWGLVVSEHEPSSIELECDDDGLIEWHDLYNGWQRSSGVFGWICRKNGRYIFITD